MKTYELIQNYEEAIRITVGPDVRCQSNSTQYEGGSGLNVSFTREVERYENEVVAAYQNVRSVVLLDDTVKVEVREYEYDEEKSTQANPPTVKWVDASKK